MRRAALHRLVRHDTRSVIDTRRFSMPNPEAQPPAFELLSGDASLGMLLIADHAHRRLPPSYGSLGLPDAEFERHIAYDIGIEGLTRFLQAQLGVPAVMAGFSRLLIDPNRGEDDPTLIRQIYDGAVVPGNYPLTDAERGARIAQFHRPYHAAVASLIAEVETASSLPPVVISLHSFTPVMQGRMRPWQVGILWDSDPRAPDALMDMLREDATLTVGDNEPYDGALKGDTLYRHCTVPGLANVLIEVRQDLIGDDEGVRAWGSRLAPMLDALNARPDMHERRQFGSRAV